MVVVGCHRVDRRSPLHVVPFRIWRARRRRATGAWKAPLMGVRRPPSLRRPPDVKRFAGCLMNFLALCADGCGRRGASESRTQRTTRISQIASSDPAMPSVPSGRRRRRDWRLLGVGRIITFANCRFQLSGHFHRQSSQMVGRSLGSGCDRLFAFRYGCPFSLVS